MAEQHLEKITGHLRSLEAFRKRALAEDNERQAARAEQAIVDMEAQVAAMMADLERQHGAPERPEEQSGTERQHILVINSDPDFLNLIRSLLQDERYNVTTTNFVPKSFDMIDTLQPALLIIDLVIGEREGWDLLEQLHREAGTRGIPVIAVSADEEELARVRWDEARYGARRVLRKPLDLHALLDAINELIGKA